jgi:hypothetical protein
MEITLFSVEYYKNDFLFAIINKNIVISRKYDVLRKH